MDHSGPGPSVVYDPEQPALPGLTLSHAQFQSGPLPPAAELQAYEDVHSGLAERIVVMAEKALDAQAATDVRPVQAEATALVVATIGITFFPWLAVVAAVVLALTGHGYGALLSGAAALLVAGPQIIAAIRKRA